MHDPMAPAQGISTLRPCLLSSLITNTPTPPSGCLAGGLEGITAANPSDGRQEGDLPSHPHGAVGTRERLGLALGFCRTQSHQEGGGGGKKEARPPSMKVSAPSSPGSQRPLSTHGYSRPPQGSRLPGCGAGP